LDYVHCHIGLIPEGACGEATRVEHARLTTSTGVLLTRDAGMPVDTRFLDSLPDAPLSIAAGQHIARPTRCTLDRPVDLEDLEHLPEALAAQALAGDGWVKLVGDWIDRDGGEGADLAPLWTPGQLTAAFAAAHANGVR